MISQQQTPQIDMPQLDFLGCEINLSGIAAMLENLEHDPGSEVIVVELKLRKRQVNEQRKQLWHPPK